MTGNGIGVEGSKTMSEMLKVNKTLTELNLRGYEQKKTRKRKRKRKKNERQTMGLEQKEQNQ